MYNISRSKTGGVLLTCKLCSHDVTGKICTRWNERESTWRKSGSCQSRGTNQSKS
jgi:hypothetical protein